jgi:hypothetical protein
MTPPTPPPSLWIGQRLHLVCLAALVAIAWAAWQQLGQPFPIAFWAAIAIPVIHQIFVWLAWRIELSSGRTSKTIGFGGYVAGFFLLFGGRFISLSVLAWLDRDSVPLHEFPRLLATATLTALGIYAMYSVIRYFGMARAAGADHFEPRYRDMPLVREGIFRFTSNGMYLYAFLLFWAIAVGLSSSAALLVAAFSHAYIWVHYYATEKPDMNFLYGKRSA